MSNVVGLNSRNWSRDGGTVSMHPLLNEWKKGICILILVHASEVRLCDIDSNILKNSAFFFYFLKSIFFHSLSQDTCSWIVCVDKRYNLSISPSPVYSLLYISFTEADRSKTCNILADDACCRKQFARAT